MDPKRLPHIGLIFSRRSLLAITMFTVGCGSPDALQATATSEPTSTSSALVAVESTSTTASSTSTSPTTTEVQRPSIPQFGEKRILKGTTDTGDSANIADATDLDANATGLVVVGDRYGAIHIFDADIDEPGVSTRAHSKAVTGVAALQTGEVISAGLDGTLRRWTLDSQGSIEEAEFESGTQGTVKPFEGSPISAMAVSVDKKWLVIGGIDGRTKYFDAETGKPYSADSDDYLLGSRVTAMAFSPTPNTASGRPPTVAVGLEDGAALFLDTESSIGSQSDDPVTTLAFSPDGSKVLLTGTTSPTVVNVETNTATEFKLLRGSRTPFSAIATQESADGDGYLIAAGGTEAADGGPASASGASSGNSTAPDPGGVLRMWSSTDPSNEAERSIDFTSEIVDMVFIDGGRRILVADSGTTMIITLQ